MNIIDILQRVIWGQFGNGYLAKCSKSLVRSERFELSTPGIEIRCSIQLSHERKMNNGVSKGT